MDFDFDVQRAFGGDPIAVVNANVLHRVRGAHKEQLERVIDTMGKRSMRAQALHNVLTMASKLRTSDHTLFVVSKRKQCLGIIKVGRKHLFIRNEMGHIKEIEPLCVLDFYVHESCQRHGIGKRLFVYMLEVRACARGHGCGCGFVIRAMCSSPPACRRRSPSLAFALRVAALPHGACKPGLRPPVTQVLGVSGQALRAQRLCRAVEQLCRVQAVLCHPLR